MKNIDLDKPFRRIEERDGKKYLQICKIEFHAKSHPLEMMGLTVLKEQEYSGLPPIGDISINDVKVCHVASSLYQLAHWQQSELIRFLKGLDLLNESNREIINSFWTAIPLEHPFMVARQAEEIEKHGGVQFLKKSSEWLKNLGVKNTGE